jgi:hypothetical protein
MSTCCSWESPPATFTVYLSGAETAMPPKTESDIIASPIINMLLRLIAAPHEVLGMVPIKRCLPDGVNYERSDLKLARTSSENSCGCSQAAKWPPLGSSLKWTRFL